jgi:hypothetical protein
MFLMSTSNPFEILNIPENSPVELIKKAFHKLIKIYHPDAGSSSDDGIARILIDSYKKALNLSKSDYETDYLFLKKYFFKLYGMDIPEPKSIKDYYFYCLFFLGEIENVFYERKNYLFYKYFLSFIVRQIDKIEKNDEASKINYFLSNMAVLVDARLKLTRSDYSMEPLRKIFIGYIKNIFESENYLEFKNRVNFPLGGIFKDMMYLFKKVKDEPLIQELSALFFIFGLFTDELFCENLFKNLEQG